MPKPKRTDKKIEVIVWSVIHTGECADKPNDIARWLFKTKKHAKDFLGSNTGNIIKCRITQVVANNKTK